MVKRPIVVMDSGIGGLPYFSRVRDLLPGERVDYVADTAHFPYGDRTDDEVVAAVLSTARRVVASLNPRIIVVACNTASVLALEKLRSAHAIPFVGVVPAVKPACGESKNRSVGVLATERTVRGKYLDDLIEQHCDDCAVIRIAAGPLVTYVEKTFGSDGASSVAAVAAPYVQRLQTARVDAVVLGCTHFVYLADDLAGAIGPGCRIIDSRDGVARQTARVIGDLTPNSEATADADRNVSTSRFFVTGEPPGSRYHAFASRYGIRQLRHLPDC